MVIFFVLQGVSIMKKLVKTIVVMLILILGLTLASAYIRYSKCEPLKHVVLT